jgi:hypothetical protein
VNVPSANTAAGFPRVTPGSPQQSFLFQKINCTNLNSIANAPYGLRMPAAEPGLRSHKYLSIAEQAAIRDWIQQGAPAGRRRHDAADIVRS